MVDALNFHRLEARLRLTGTMTTVTGLHVGAGTPAISDGLDQPVLRDALGLPFIPGASLKGVLRSTLESLVRALDGRRMTACDPLARDACGAHERGERSQAMAAEHCTICALFGSRVLASHVRISDALMVDSERVSPVEVRDGVAIDRDTGTVRGPLKFDFEVVPPGVGFDLEVFVENPVPWAMGLLMIGFDQIHRGYTTVGGFGSRGLGRVKIAWSA
ncbi:MAG: CRISPR-associated RAMP protein, partial [Actinobacteria bacterium]|nr:CRISPR-associated RAMP protein [Actinomycetota bacterium]